MHILHAAYNSLIMKENEHRSIKHSFKNTFSHQSFSQWQDSDRWQSSWNYSYVTRNHRKVYFLSKVINSSTRLLKSNLLKSCDEWWLWIIWKLQNTLKTWNDYLRYNNHKNKIIKETKHLHFRLQMHKLSNESKSVWHFAKWIRIESQLLKKLSQFLSLKNNDFDHITNSFEEKTKMLWKKFFSSSFQANINDILRLFILLTMLFNSILLQDEMRQMIQWIKVNKASDAFEIFNKAL